MSNRSQSALAYSSYCSCSPSAGPQPPPAHLSITKPLSLLLEPTTSPPKPNERAILQWDYQHIDFPPDNPRVHSPPAPLWTPITGSSPQQSPPIPPTPPPVRPEDYDPVDLDALLEHDPFKLAEEWGGNWITDRSRLFWIEGRNPRSLPSLEEIGLDKYVRLDKAGVRQKKDFWSVIL